MFNGTETAERQYLANMIAALMVSLKGIEQKVMAHAGQLIETKQFAWQNAAQLDPVELAAYRIAVNEESAFAELSLKERNALRKLVASPYFGRIDFKADGEPVHH